MGRKAAWWCMYGSSDGSDDEERKGYQFIEKRRSKLDGVDEISLVSCSY